MDDRSISTPAPEMPMAAHGAGSLPAAPGPLGDPRALTILTTEHWSLLSARSLVYNEAFSRAGMFLAFLSATLVALGLVTTATGFSDAFLVVAAVVLALDLFIGLASLGRMTAASGEDIRYLQGMNRLRHAYHEMVPGLEPYFISRHHDDAASVLSHYGAAPTGGVFDVLHALTTTPVMVGVICSAVGGALAAVLAVLLTHTAAIASVAGLAAFVLVFGGITAVVRRRIGAMWRSMQVVFPRDEEPRG